MEIVVEQVNGNYSQMLWIRMEKCVKNYKRLKSSLEKNTSQLVIERTGNNVFVFAYFQSSSLGRGYVTNGGIGQRTIAITIEAQKTLFYRQNIQIYGN